MRSSRRSLLKGAVAASAAALTGGVPSLFAREDAPSRKLKILVLGGTGLIGPSLVKSALERGHTVTLFNRGKTRTELFPEVERLIGDRDPSKGEGVNALVGKSFDVCFDDCGYYPRHVKASAEALAKTCGHYVFTSSISAYAEETNAIEDLDETAKLATMADPTLETMGDNYQYYGALKALCEQASEAAFPGRCTVIRPGYIVGPEDWTDRFTYWPWRVAKGGKMLAPGNPTDPIQVIDVRDLTDFMLKVAETKAFGVFNAVGPERRLTMGEVLDTSKRVTKSDAEFVWVDAPFLAKYGEEAAARKEAFDLPIWAAYEGASKGFHTWKNERAIGAGMRFRSIETTITDTLEWRKMAMETIPRMKEMRAGLTPEIEARVLEAYAAAKAGSGKSGG